ncbi:keratin-associated protein 5-5-like isoform X2 [Bombus huntii]|uniref:keratin-associated protein 5-5-like isoform X2 n=1 Tax=Bombus huntii TaxID=85661 RepID=UPI0021AA4FC0|nr:keratin-associated protein 5-5-like isoform X2 [Bombus huntii]
MTTICDPSPSPNAITTWYNRQHSKFRSTLSLESQKNNDIAKDCRFEAQKQETDQSEPKILFSNNEVNITEAQLSASECGEEDTISKCNDIEKNRGQDRCVKGNSESRTYRIMNEKDDASSKEDMMTYAHQSGPNSSLDENERMRGGCGGPCGTRLRPSCGTTKVETACLCRRDPSEQCRTAVTSCTTCSSNVQPVIERRCCCSSSLERPICKKPIFRCRQPCTVESQSCGGGGCCGGGCRGGCGKPGQMCLPAKSCVVPPCRPCSPCSPPRSCPQVICCCGPKSGNCCGNGGSTCCCRSKSPICRVRTRRCCSTDRAEPIDLGCCRPKTACDCFGGGLDCQRCGRKVYQAEMQIVSGIPFHNTCFSCYCCRKPLEPLTYQENCGEIYCKQCYVRNFGPQGYGYGVGPGTLQTPM